MARRWRNTGFFQIRGTGVTAPWGCAGGTPPSRAAVFSGPTGSRISTPSKFMISFSMRISCWSSIGRRVSVSPGMNQFPGRSSPPAAVLFQAVSKVLSAVGNHTGRSSTGRSPSFPLAWRSPRLTTGIICAASFPRSIKACWSPFKRWIRQSTSRKWCSS